MRGADNEKGGWARKGGKERKGKGGGAWEREGEKRTPMRVSQAIWSLWQRD